MMGRNKGRLSFCTPAFPVKFKSKHELGKKTRLRFFFGLSKVSETRFWTKLFDCEQDFT